MKTVTLARTMRWILLSANRTKRSHQPAVVNLVLIATLMALPSMALAGPRCSGELSRLMTYAGSYEADQLLDDPQVSTALKALLGPELEHLKRNLDVHGPVGLRGCELVLEGNAPHAGGLENGIVSVSIYDGTVSAGILSGGRITIYQNDSDYAAVPIGIKDWIAAVESAFSYRARIPNNATLVTPAPERNAQAK